jgi:hypothetical protein
MLRLTNLIVMRILLINTLFLIAISAAWAQSKRGAARFFTTEHNMGNIMEENGSQGYRFEFVNKGGGDLKIRNVLTSCGCTTTDWSKGIVKPNDTGFVYAVFDPENRLGEFNKTITVITDGNPEMINLIIKGFVGSKDGEYSAIFPHKIGNMRFTQPILSLPEVEEDGIDTVFLGFYNNSSKSININNVLTPMPISTESKTLVLPPQTGNNIMFLYYGTRVKKLGPRVDTLIITTNDETEPMKIIPIQAVITQNFNARSAFEKSNPPKAIFSTYEMEINELYIGEKGTADFEITNTGIADLVIRDWIPASPSVSAQILTPVIKKGKKGKVRVIVDSKGLRGSVSKMVTFITNDPKNTYINIKVNTRVVVPGM